MIEKRSIWWKIYFYILLLLILLSMAGFVIDDSLYRKTYTSDKLYDIFILSIFAISFVGFFGFIYIKKIFYKEFWIWILLINLIDCVGTILLETQTKEILWGSIIFLPFYFALYKYSFKMNELWRDYDK